MQRLRPAGRGERGVLRIPSVQFVTVGVDRMPPMPAVPERPVLVAPDSFKGTFRPREVAAAIGARAEAPGWCRPTCCPVADGGEGTLDVAARRARRRDRRGATVARPARPRRSTAGFGAARGRPHGDRRDGRRRAGCASWPRTSATPWAASTRGTGELIAAAVEAGARGGHRRGRRLAPPPTAAPARWRRSSEAGGLRGATLVVVCDVRTPWEGARRGLRPAEGRRPGDGRAAGASG